MSSLLFPLSYRFKKAHNLFVAESFWRRIIDGIGIDHAVIFPVNQNHSLFKSRRISGAAQERRFIFSP